jgi:hypothetical protein
LLHKIYGMLKERKSLRNGRRSTLETKACLRAAGEHLGLKLNAAGRRSEP